MGFSTSRSGFLADKKSPPKRRLPMSPSVMATPDLDPRISREGLAVDVPTDLAMVMAIGPGDADAGA